MKLLHLKLVLIFSQIIILHWSKYLL